MADHTHYTKESEPDLVREVFLAFSSDPSYAEAAALLVTDIEASEA